MWLTALMATHAAQLLSHPDIADELSPILSVVDAKLTLLTELSRLRGRVSLITGQISHINEKQDRDPTEDSLLVYQDQGNAISLFLIFSNTLLIESFQIVNSDS